MTHYNSANIGYEYARPITKVIWKDVNCVWTDGKGKPTVATLDRDTRPQHDVKLQEQLFPRVSGSSFSRGALHVRNGSFCASRQKRSRECPDAR